jgi:hypothetical protein
MGRYELSHIKGDHLWKWVLVIGAVLIAIAMYMGGRLHDIEDTRFRLDIHSAFWALCILLLSILVFVDLVGLEVDVEGKVGLIIIVELVLGVAWAYFDYKKSETGLLLTQVLILVSVAYLIYLFSNISRFAFWISIVYFLSVAYATFILLDKSGRVF